MWASMYKPCGLFRESLSGPLPTLICTRHLASMNRMPPWIVIPEMSQTPNLMEMLDADSSVFSKASKFEERKTLFERKAEHFLKSRCLLVKDAMGSSEVKQIHLMNRKLLGHHPVYTNAHRVS